MSLLGGKEEVGGSQTQQWTKGWMLEAAAPLETWQPPW